MSRLTAYYNLCPIHDTKDFLGLSNDGEEGSIIVTLGRNIVKIIKLTTQNLICSWTTQDKLSLKVVYDKKSEQYIGVFSNKYMRCWNKDASDINKIKKIKFQKSIYEVISSNLLDEVLLIYQDGSCESLSSGIELHRKNVMEKQPLSSTAFETRELILDPHIFEFRNGHKLLTYFLKNRKDNSVQLVTSLLSEDNLRSILLTKYLLYRRGITLSGYTVVDGQNSPSLLTIWSDKRIFMMNLKDNVQPEDAPGNFVSMLTIFNVDYPISIIGISTHCIAIYGANNVQEGASLVLYNTQFKVVKAKQFFKIYFDFSRLWVVENNILLAMGQNLTVCTFRVSKEQLSELVGSQILKDFNALPEISDDFINEEDQLEEILLYSKAKGCKNNHRESNLQNLVNILTKVLNRNKKGINDESDRKEKVLVADGKTVPYMPYEIFENNIRYACNYNDFEIEILHYHDMESFDNIEIDLRKHVNFMGFITKPSDILTKILEKYGTSEQEITEKLIPVLLKADRIEEIINFLRKYTLISERALARILKYTLSNFIPSQLLNIPTSYIEKETSIENVCMDADGKEPSSLSNTKKNEKFKLLNAIISCSFDVENFSTYIRKEVDFKHIFILLEHLYNTFISLDNWLEERPDTWLDSDENCIILKWLTLILNTYFQQLALSRDLQLINLLTKWLNIINIFKSNLNELCDLSHIIYQLINCKFRYKEKPYTKWYSVEDIKLY